MKRHPAPPQMFGRGGGGWRWGGERGSGSVLHPSPLRLHTLQPFSRPGSLDKVRIVCQQAVMSGMLRASPPPHPPQPCVSIHHPSCCLSKLFHCQSASALTFHSRICVEFTFLPVLNYLFFLFPAQNGCKHESVYAACCWQRWGKKNAPSQIQQIAPSWIRVPDTG